LNQSAIASILVDRCLTTPSSVAPLYHRYIEMGLPPCS
jgi:hypothetical protein